MEWHAIMDKTKYQPVLQIDDEKILHKALAELKAQGISADFMA
jgi:hypothetical protein